jgi:glycosyltransferase involved in cell wall biosynthesis
MAENSIKISVVMPVYNADIFLEEAIRSILTQTYSNFEFIIICSSPSDETKRILTKYQKIDTRLLITYQEKKGIIFARNFGCRLATGKYIAIMDADDISVPDRLETQATFMERNPDIGIVGSWVDYIDESGRLVKNFCPPTNHLVIGWHLIFGNCMVHLTAMIRSDIFKELEYYPLSKDGFPEDYDLWARAFLTTKLANIPKSLGKYRMHQSNNSLLITKELHQFCFQIQNKLINQLIEKDHYPLLEKIQFLNNSSIFEFNYTMNDFQVDFIETLYGYYNNKYSPSQGDKKENKAKISLILLSYSWSMFPFSKAKSLNLLFKSLNYSTIAVIRKIISVIWQLRKRKYNALIQQFSLTSK